MERDLTYQGHTVSKLDPGSMAPKLHLCSAWLHASKLTK